MALKRTLFFVLKVLAGLALGFLLFLPTEGIWRSVLEKAAKQLEPHKMTWEGIQDAGLTGFTLTGFSLKTQQGTIDLSLSRVKIRLGLFTLAEVTATTGPSLTLTIKRDKTVLLSGGFDLSALNRKNVSGQAKIQGDMTFPAWGAPPSSGQISLSADTLNLPGGLNAENIQASAQLADSRLTITGFEAEKPLPVKAQGFVDLVWTNPRTSNYSLTGAYSLAGKEQTFQKSGTLEQVPGM